MNLQQGLLLALSRSPGSDDYNASWNEWSIDSALSLLEAEYPDFGRRVAGRRILDFGCGAGYQCVALARQYDCTVLGIESHPKLLQQAKDLACREGLAREQLDFAAQAPDSVKGCFDVVVSQNSFEHFREPGRILAHMRELIKDKGSILITFGPPWLAPYGGHMNFFCLWPWIHVVFSERAVMAVRSRYRKDGAARYEDVESGLNQMTIAKFERLIRESRLCVEHKHYRCVKGLTIASRVPVLREFLINHVSVTLTRSS